MSLHFLLNLPYTASEELLEKSYKKKIIETHPDRSKKNTVEFYYKLKKAYNDYKLNLTNLNFYLECYIEDINLISCRCGTLFNQDNLVYDRVECETCSCFILVTQDWKFIM